MTYHQSPSPGIGGTVRQLRLARGMTQGQLAESAGIANETLSRIETGARTSVSIGVAMRLSDSLGVPVTHLLEPLPANTPGKLRPAERALLSLVSTLSDAEVAEFVRAVRTFVKLGRRIGAPAPPHRKPSTRGR